MVAGVDVMAGRHSRPSNHFWEIDRHGLFSAFGWMFRSGTRHRTWPRVVLPMQSDGIGTVAGVSAEAAGPLAPS